MWQPGGHSALWLVRLVQWQKYRGRCVVAATEPPCSPRPVERERGRCPKRSPRDRRWRRPMCRPRCRCAGQHLPVRLHRPRAGQYLRLESQPALGPAQAKWHRHRLVVRADTRHALRTLRAICLMLVGVAGMYPSRNDCESTCCNFVTRASPSTAAAFSSSRRLRNKPTRHTVGHVRFVASGSTPSCSTHRANISSVRKL